ncbi:hypothetical protein BESB_035320 [Besnoitia besnoiti]|uniref:PRA1 family protein n=1 Tax=Besnoitia besnoiti TaxID=94643 RepID=A0A2A9MIP4_BESBE|nr:hypothetical protein BESB_035320 [Besnoitia besnoiti]PFH37074.1 hypothetical protein BESB_035320 [Besnoitia besnoiti]
MLDPTDNMDDFYNDTSAPAGAQLPPPAPHLASASAPSAAFPSSSARPLAATALSSNPIGRGGEDGPFTMHPKACGSPHFVENPLARTGSGDEKCRRDEGSLRGSIDSANPLTVAQSGGAGGSRNIRTAPQTQEAFPSLHGVVSGKMGDGGGSTLGAPQQRPQFSVSQLQAAYRYVQHSLLSKAVSWTEFVHIPSFQKPATGATAVDRVERNLRYFYMNYIIICSVLAVVAALLNPVVLVIGGVFGGAAFLAGFKGDNTLRIGDTVLPVKTFRFTCLAVAALTIFLVAGHIVVSLSLGCALIVMLHASLHIGVSYEQIAQHSACSPEFDV